ncbi:MAG TPA: SMC family ATPase [Ktedonobacteraceae bacterium]|nr:SMC family ATPase [Ktedonobacteraceae bacterium]
MLITRIELENIKSYRHLAVDFRRGTTAISGANGAGKTTLVEAIGYALFNYLSYNQSQFVREGEKFGKVVVHLIGSDDRPYVVERRCGAGASWMVYDEEADSRVEQRADVLDKLHELFGIDRERPLESLFSDALGVPQGTFTAIFLDKPAKRKETFNALLQIEDYKIAFDYLLDVRKQYEEQIQEQKNKIHGLEIETRELGEWRASLKNAQQEDGQKKARNAEITQQLVTARARAELLKQRREELQRCHSRHEQQKTVYAGAQERLASSLNSLSEAQTAHLALENSQADYERYTEADALLRQLRQDEARRNTLLQQQHTHANALATVKANISHFQSRLREVESARQLLIELTPLVEQQYELEKRRDNYKQQVTQYQGLLKEVKRLDAKQVASLQQLAVTQQRIAAIEPLIPLAEQLNARIEHMVSLQAKTQERRSKRLQYEEKNKQLQEKREERERATANLRKAEDFLLKLEEHRSEAEELPKLQIEFEELTARHHRLEGNIDGYKKSRRLSAGGLCPLLHEPCQNIQVHGIGSLESYFDDEIKKDQEALAIIGKEQAILTERMTPARRYADEFSKLGQYTERRDRFADQIKQAAQDVLHLERETESLQEDLNALALVEQDIAQAKVELDESQTADQQVRTLDGLYQQEEQLRASLKQLGDEMSECARQADELRDSARHLQQVEEQITALNDPRSASKAQQEILKREAGYRQQLQMEESQGQQHEQQLQELLRQLAQYSNLDAHIGQQEAVREQCKAGFNTYLKNQDVARQLPERQRAHQEAAHKAEQATSDLQAAEQAYHEAEAAFSPQEFSEVETHIKNLDNELAGLAIEMSNLQDKINELTRKIDHAEVLLRELEAAAKEKGTLEDLQKMVEQFRKLIRDAAPHVLKAMLDDISSEANRIFGEIMGDRSAQLSWDNDYEIMLRRQGVNRTFAQLSGGEQMSAALAVRLALLKKLSTLNVAFFDEPTQNMDELRRTNLAEQIRRVRGFDQLFVISHDDTFEQSLDSLVRLRKKDGETQLISDEDVMMMDSIGARAEARVAPVL